MEAAKVHGEAANAWESSKRSRAEETSTTYKPPTCEDPPSSPERQVTQLTTKSKQEIETQLSAKSKDPAEGSSFSKQSVSWSEVPPIRYPPSEGTSRFSQATTAIPHRGYSNDSPRPQVPISRPTQRPIVVSVDSSMDSNSFSSRNRPSRTDIRVNEYSDSSSESEEESEDSWDLRTEEKVPEDSASRPRALRQNTRDHLPRPPMGVTPRSNRTDHDSTLRERANDRGIPNVLRGAETGSKSRSKRTQSTENNPPSPEPTYMRPPSQGSATPWSMPQPNFWRTPPRLSDLSAANPLANTYLPFDHTVYPYPAPYHDMSQSLPAWHNPYYSFQPHPAWPNQVLQERLPGPTQVMQGPTQTNSPALVSSEPASREKIDPIELVEDYLQSLRSSKETELSEATRILSWIDQRST